MRCHPRERNPGSGLADGTYDVTLSCVTSSVIALPVDDWRDDDDRRRRRNGFQNFLVNGQTFVGAPGNATVTTVLFGRTRFRS